MIKEKKISLILPAFNESENLEILIKKINIAFTKNNMNKNLEIIIVNDGSQDNTSEIAEKLLDQYDNLILINLKTNNGKAYALDIGINNSKGEIICIMDADIQYSPEDLIKMINLIYDGYDLINGKRNIRKDSFLTIFFSKIYNYILRKLFKIKLNDFFSGIKVYKKEIFNLMDYSGLSRFVIFFSSKYNYNISEISVNHNNRIKGQTSYNFIDKIVLSMKDIFSLVICIALGKERIYQIKQTILSIYFLILLTLIFEKIFLNQIKIDYILYILLSFFVMTIFNIIVQSFLRSKEKNTDYLNRNIKNIKRSNNQLL